MVKRRKKRKNKFKLIKWLGSFLVFIFVLSLIILSWGFISENIWWFLIISGIGVLILIILGLLAPSKVKRKIQKEFE